MPPTRRSPPPIPRLRAEAPLLLGVGTGLLLLWWLGGAFVLDGDVRGYTWPGYFQNAWNVVHGYTDLLSPFRKPLHGWLLGSLGAHLGYADAAILIASACGAAMVASAGVLGRALAGPTAGGLAAASVPLCTLVVSASRWGTTYPLLAAGTGIALAAAAVFARWPRPGTLAAAAVGLWLALASDDRGVLVVPVVALLGVAGAVRGRRAVRWLALPLLILTGPLALGTDHALGLRPPVTASWETKRKIQKGVVHRWVNIDRDQELVRACMNVPEAAFLELSFFETGCARGVLRNNNELAIWRLSPFPGWTLWWALPLWLLPGCRRGSLIDGALVAGSGAAIWLFMGSSTPLPPRYVLQIAVPMAVILPVGLGRLTQTVLPRRWAPWVGVALAAVVWAWAWQTDPHQRSSPTARSLGDWSTAKEHESAAVVRQMVPKTDVFLDCAHHNLNSALLPDLVFGPHPDLAPEVSKCQQWLGFTPGKGRRYWLGVDPERPLKEKRSGRSVKMDALLRDTPGWTRVHHSATFELWVLGADDQLLREVASDLE